MSILPPKPATSGHCNRENYFWKKTLFSTNSNSVSSMVQVWTCLYGYCTICVPILHGLKLWTLVCLQLIPFSLSHELLTRKKYKFRKASYFSTTHQFILGSCHILLDWEPCSLCPHSNPSSCFVFRTLCCDPSHICTHPPIPPTMVPSLPGNSHSFPVLPHFPLLHCAMVPFLPDYSFSSLLCFPLSPTP